ncbi:hypothetical protein VTI28DRAFT_564 [Corynascus sepedonium]
MNEESSSSRSPNRVRLTSNSRSLDAVEEAPGARYLLRFLPFHLTKKVAGLLKSLDVTESLSHPTKKHRWYCQLSHGCLL